MPLKLIVSRQKENTAANIEIKIITDSDKDSHHMQQDTQAAEAPSNNEESYNDNYWIEVESKQRKVAAQISLKYLKTNNQITERIFDVESF